MSQRRIKVFNLHVTRIFCYGVLLVQKLPVLQSFFIELYFLIIQILDLVTYHILEHHNMLKQLDPRFPYAVRSSSRAIAPSLPIPNPTMHLRARREIPRLRSQGREGGRVAGCESTSSIRGQERRSLWHGMGYCFPCCCSSPTRFGDARYV